MGKVLYSYDVFDKQERKYLLKNVPLSKVSEVTGLGKGNISDYADNGYIYNDRYHITRHKIGEPIQNIDIDSNAYVPEDIQNKWDDVVGAIKLLQNGGHFVYKNGKRHHVEA